MEKTARSATSMKEARQMLDRGEVPPAGILGPVVSKSWERCLGAGLTPFGRIGGPERVCLSRLKETLDERRELVSRARPVMEYLYVQVRGTGCMIILADHHGLLIEALGDAGFVKRAARVALQPGASWHESSRGTNAIGTALAEVAPVVVHGAEHFLDDNRFLTCAAAPVTGPDGRLQGVIDISGHQSARHPHTAGLVRTACHMIENRLFELSHAGTLRLHIHPQAEGIGTVAEGLVALSENGDVVGANTAALAFLGLSTKDISRVSVEKTLSVDLTGIHTALRLSGRIIAVTSMSGRLLALRAEAVPKTMRHPSSKPSAAPVRDALADLDTGDERMRLIIGRARKIAGKPIPILLQGESGAGKECFASAIHASGPRKNAPFVAVDCAALPEHLIESELFGYAPGAFTGARKEGSLGRIREANGGTLFLDEIGDMTLSLQCRLLRVLQQREVAPLGGGKSAKVDFALIAASHRPLKAEVGRGRFREDLYYRLNGLTLTLPALRERSDFSALISRMIASFAPEVLPTVAPDVLAAFMAYRWPGNLRQLANALQFACAILDPGELMIGWRHLPDDLLEDLRDKPAQCPADERKRGGEGCPFAGAQHAIIGEAESLRVMSVAVMEQAVAASGGNMSEAARRLGVSRNTLYRKLRRACSRSA